MRGNAVAQSNIDADVPTPASTYVPDRRYFSAPMVVTGCHFIDLT
jgi:hypothetical protein